MSKTDLTELILRSRFVSLDTLPKITKDEGFKIKVAVHLQLFLKYIFQISIKKKSLKKVVNFHQNHLLDFYVGL